MRNESDVKEYLARRMPCNVPLWVVDRLHLLLVSDPELRIAEKTDLLAGSDIYLLPMAFMGNLVPKIESAAKARLDIPQEGDQVDCVRTIDELLFLNVYMPKVRQPYYIPLVKSADPDRSLLEQLDELRAAERKPDYVIEVESLESDD
jgi:hypothetical protein